MSNHGDFNGSNNGNGRRSIGSSNRQGNASYGNGNNSYNNNNYMNSNSNKYAKYGANNYKPSYNTPNNSNNLNGHNSSSYSNNQYNNIEGLEENYQDLDLSMDETSLEELAAQKKALKIAKIKMGIKITSIVLLVTILVAGIFIYVNYGADIMQLRAEAIEAVRNSSRETFTKKSASKYYAKQGGEWVEIQFASQTTSEYISIKDGGESMEFACNLMCLSEDRNFYKHEGVDFMANVKAIIKAIMNGGKAERGASTITQQLSRNVILEDFDKNWKRKVKEMFVSWELEDIYTKEEILEFYLNNINFSNGYTGIESAAKGYFGKSITELNRAEIAFLCAIPNNPTLYNPYTQMDNTMVRKDRLLQQVYDYGDDVLTKAELSECKATNIELQKESVEASVGDKTIKLDRLLKAYIEDCAAEAVMEKVYRFNFKDESELTEPAVKQLYDADYQEIKNSSLALLNKNGYLVYTSIDLDMQKSLQENIDNQVKSLSGGKKTKDDGVTYQIQSAGVCIDNATGCVVAMVNGRSSDAVNYLPRAYGQVVTGDDGKTKYLYANQPGSAIKPLLVYGPAYNLRDGEVAKYTNATLREDNGPVEREGGSGKVKNSNSVYKGNISIQEAIKGSSNVVAYSLYNEIYKNENRNYAMKFLEKMNFRFLDKSDYTNIGVSIGGFAYGSTPLEMAAAYATIENDGEYRKPTAVVAVEEKNSTNVNNLVIKSKKVFEQSTARRLTTAMQEVFRGATEGGYNGTAAGKSVSMDCAGKTGTTNGKADAWFCGYTPCYTTAIWVGDDDNKETGISGGNVATIWQKFNQAVINKKKLSSSKNTFNLVIMDNSEPEYLFSLEPTETLFEFETGDPGDIIIPSGMWPGDQEEYTYYPMTEEPSEEPTMDIPGFSSEPLFSSDPGENNPDPGNGNGNNQGNGNGNSNGNIGGPPGREETGWGPPGN